MKASFPLLTPRKSKKPTTVNTYTKHLKSSSRLGVYLLGTIGSLILVLIIFVPQISNYFGKSTNSSASSSSSTAPAKSTVISIKNSLNQSCTLKLVEAPPIQNFAKSVARSLWYSPVACAVDTLTSVRVIMLPNFVDTASAQSFTPSGTTLTFLSYSKIPGANPALVDLDRYQLILSGNLVPVAQLFDSSKVFLTNKQPSAQFYLESSCSTQSSPCALWMQSKLSGKYEKLYSFDTTAGLIRFTSISEPNSITLIQKTPTTSTIYVIDLITNNNILKKTYLNTDPVLQEY